MRTTMVRVHDDREKDQAESLSHFNEKENVQTEKYLLLPRTPRPTRDTTTRRVRGVLALRSISDSAQSRLPREGQSPSDHVLDPRDLGCSEADTCSLSDPESLRAALHKVSTQPSQSREHARASQQEPVSMDLRWQELVQDVDTFSTNASFHLSNSCLTDSNQAPHNQSASQSGYQDTVLAFDIHTSKAPNNPGWLAINAAYRFAEATTDLPTVLAESPPSRPFEVVPPGSQPHFSQSVDELERTKMLTLELFSHNQFSLQWSETLHGHVKKSALHLPHHPPWNNPFISPAETSAVLARKFREDASRWWRRVIEPNTSVHAPIIF